MLNTLDFTACNSKSFKSFISCTFKSSASYSKPSQLVFLIPLPNLISEGLTESLLKIKVFVSLGMSEKAIIELGGYSKLDPLHSETDVKRTSLAVSLNSITRLLFPKMSL